MNQYLLPLAVRIRGPLQLAALQSAVQALEHHYESLCTTFATVEGANVHAVQSPHAKEVNVIDMLTGDEQGVAAAARQDQTTPFDLRTESRWRASIYHISKDDHVLSIVMHYVVSDLWSINVIMNELAMFYSASMRGLDPLSQVPPVPIEYRELSLWQRQQAQVSKHHQQLSYWVAQLQTSRPAELLCDKPRPATLSGQIDTRSLKIGGPLYADLHQFCQLHGVTRFAALLAAFRVTHFRLTGQDDAIIGTVNANCDRWEVKDTTGFFVNMQCLRLTVREESFEELVQQVQAVVVASHANADVPFESVISELKNDRDLSRRPLVQLVFAMHSKPELGQLRLEGVETENFGNRELWKHSILKV
uniref:Condensation domain containing protein n=1 Tax=Alternaria alternata TaxID=5599 RepID=C9K7J0_ALTAL|nr:condensation domain containing protein [Alternaria alternata]